eukprot:TRINITY_DN13962_c0_g1_i1.p1 TRINITY_DN13962_c0_g1~~TRINITY_DN13962_c0_g1_i1.p1  ORF type:complete len:460 (+),score=111.29 TRINITY_DN13962_c0_g1_i1:152-1381(+)
MSGADVKAIASGLKGNQTLTNLSLVSARIGLTDSFQNIAMAIQDAAGLTSVDLSDNDLKDDSVGLIGAIVENTPSLTHCNLSHNELGPASMAKILLQAAKGKCKSINLIGNATESTAALGDTAAMCSKEGGLTALSAQLSPSALAAFTARLEPCKLTSLNLTQSKLLLSSGMQVAAWLHSNPPLTSLSLTHTYMGAAAGSALATALGNNTILTHLELAHNALGSNAACALATAISRSPSLTSVGVRSNDITDAGATAIAAAIVMCSTLTRLDLSANPIADAGGAALLAAVSMTSALRDVSTLERTQMRILVQQAILARVKNNADDYAQKQAQAAEAAREQAGGAAGSDAEQALRREVAALHAAAERLRARGAVAEEERLKAVAALEVVNAQKASPKTSRGRGRGTPTRR